MNKKILIPTLGLLALSGLTILGVSSVKADEGTLYPPMMQRFMERFNLNEDEVDSFMNEMHQERVAQIQQTREEKLNQAVANGVITQEQKDALMSKWQEMQQERDQERNIHQEEMQTWFNEQGIDHDAIMQFMGGGFGRHEGFGGRGGYEMH